MTGDRLRVTISDVSGAKAESVELPVDREMRRLIPGIVTKLQLPEREPNGDPIVYGLQHKRSQKQLRPDATLRSEGVKEDDILRLVPTVTSAGS